MRPQIHPTFRASLACCAIAAVMACTRTEAPVAPGAGKTQPPPVLPSPPKAPAFLRDHYVKLDDCAYDWGSAQKCRSVAAGSTAQQAGANFYGPIYAKGYREETQAQLRREAIAGGYAAKVGEDASDRSSARSEATVGAN